jgi:hypothetical protein
MISSAMTETKFFCAIAKLNKGEGASYSKLLRIVEANGIARRAHPSMVFDSEDSVLVNILADTIGYHGRKTTAPSS